MLDKGGIEAPQARKAGREGDLLHRQLAVGQQRLGQQQAAGLQVLQR